MNQTSMEMIIPLKRAAFAEGTVASASMVDVAAAANKPAPTPHVGHAEKAWLRKEQDIGRVAQSRTCFGEEK